MQERERMPDDEEHAGSAAQLTGRERRQVARSIPPTALVVHEIIREAGEDELERTSSSLLWSGLAAGLSMGFNLVALGLLAFHLPEAQWAPLVQSFGYTVGFVIVILGRQQLFTENTITVVIPLLTRRSFDCLLDVARVWGLVLTANLVGTAIFAALAFHAPLASPDLHEPFLEIALHAVDGGFLELAAQGVLAGWLIALMVWLLPAAGSARVFVILFITYVIGLGGFAHIIAGSTEAFYAVFAGELRFLDYLVGYFVPVLIGNVIGGTALVAIVNHAQVRDEVTGEEGRRNKARAEKRAARADKRATGQAPAE